MLLTAVRQPYIGTTTRLNGPEYTEAACSQCGRTVWVGESVKWADRVMCPLCATPPLSRFVLEVLAHIFSPRRVLS
jgi:DNA-directed RNA polymerase subunit RPC12/RpoP